MRNPTPHFGRAALVGLLLLLPGSATGQRGSANTDATTIALQWISGRFRMPVSCIRKDGSRIELEEALVIRPAPEHGNVNTLKATFFGIDVADISRCFNLLIPHIPDRRGILYFTFRSHERPDLGANEFRRRLRDGELRYPIQDGQLREHRFGEEKSEARVVKFSRRGMELVVRPVHAGSDADKLLAPYAEREPETKGRERRFEIEIEGPDDFVFRGYFIADPKWRR